MERFLTPSSSYKESDIDFNDVFGGPPKRSSSHELRYTFTEPTRRNSRTEEEDDDGILPRNPSAGTRERPVFGEDMGSRRKYKSDDFYDDIFRGDEPVGSPRRVSHEPFRLSPGSREISPSRADTFGTSLPAQVQFSLPPKLTREMDLPAFASGNRSQHKYKEPISSNKSFTYSPNSPHYRPSPLSYEVSLNSEVPCLTINPEGSKSPEVQNKVKYESKSTEAVNNGNQFHFSFYKWASKGVPISIPRRGVKSAKLEDNFKNEVFSSIDETVENEKQDIGSQKSDLQDIERNVSANNKVHHAEEMKQARGETPNTTKMNYESVSTSDKKAEIKIVDQDTQDARKSKLKSLRSFLGTSEEEGKGKTNEKSEKKANVMRNASDMNEGTSKQVHKREVKKHNSKREEMIQEKVDPEKGSRENTKRSKAKGKVKEFVNISNQEADLKPKTNTETNSQSFERGTASSEKANKETHAKTQQTKGNRVSGLNKNKKPSSSTVRLDKNLEELEKQQPDLKNSDSDVKGNFSGERVYQPWTSESGTDKAQAIAEDLDDFLHENFTVQELSNDQDKPVVEDNYEDVKTSDARIRKWSKGKEGNIRSLLSTLQYVLWPGSGWKPVPLVDIIEGNAVKRSYQRAMLCLHPDKLQQKGAAHYQKYIAEKVVDILQKSNMKFGPKKGWKPKVPLRLRGKSCSRFSLFPKIKPASYGPGNAPVYLNVYDLTPMNGYVYWAGFGIFHSGVEVHGVEYAFGAHDYPSSGVFEVEPRQCPGFQFRRSILIGTTSLDPAKVREFMETHSANYNGDTYHLIAKNCNHFCKDVCYHLTGKKIPQWVNRLAKLGSVFNCVLPEALKVSAVRHDPTYEDGDNEKRRLTSAFSSLSSISTRQRQLSTSSMFLQSPLKGCLPSWETKKANGSLKNA